MAYEDWTPEFQDLWENTLGTEELTPAQADYAEFMFEEGFMHYSGEVSRDDIEFARQEFFDLIGEEYFDWEGWREAMGYDLCQESATKPSPAIGRNPKNGRGFVVPNISKRCGLKTPNTG
jgi:hypothetical protein